MIYNYLFIFKKFEYLQKLKNIVIYAKLYRQNYNKSFLMSSLTYHSTASATIEMGIKLIFFDLNPNTLCIDVELLKTKITK